MVGGAARGFTTRATALLALAILITASAVASASENGQVRGTIEPLAGKLPLSPNGTAVRYDRAVEGTTALVWGHEGPDDLRVVDGDLGTLGVLASPALPGFHVKGVSISDGSEKALVWGSTGGGSNDTIVIYDLTSLAAIQDYLPDGLVGLVTVDHARFYAYDKILAVAGRAASGSSELVFIETGPMQVLLRYALPGNASAQYHCTDGISMACLLEDGQLVVISTRDWSVVRTVKLVEGPFTAWYITMGFWYLGSGDGKLVIWDTYISRILVTIHMDGAVQGVCQAVNGLNHTLVVAMPSPDGGSSLRALRSVDSTNWTLAAELDLPVPVTMLYAHHTSSDAVLVCHDDGSIETLRVWTWEYYKPRSGIRPIYLIMGVATLVCVLGLLLWSRRRRALGTPT